MEVWQFPVPCLNLRNKLDIRQSFLPKCLYYIEREVWLDSRLNGFHIRPRVELGDKLDKDGLGGIKLLCVGLRPEIK